MVDIRVQWLVVQYTSTTLNDIQPNDIQPNDRTIGGSLTDVGNGSILFEPLPLVKALFVRLHLIMINRGFHRDLRFECGLFNNPTVAPI